MARLREMAGLLSVGGFTLDYVRTSTKTAGPTLGGNALYAAVGGWLVGARPTIAARVGDDLSHAYLTELRQAGFDLDYVASVEGPSFKVLLDESTGARVQSYMPGSGTNRTLDPSPERLPNLA